jgi:hypothetical protein
MKMIKVIVNFVYRPSIRHVELTADDLANTILTDRAYLSFFKLGRQLGGQQLLKGWSNECPKEVNKF